MRVLGIDASLTNFGWAIHDTDFPLGDSRRCPVRGRLQTSAKKMEFIERYVYLREGLRDLVKKHSPDRVGLEYPVFDAMYSAGLYGLFLFTCEALRDEGCDVVFWQPLQIKAHARDSLVRPSGWIMDKQDMCEAAQVDTGITRWNHNEADAYLCAKLAGRFWLLYEEALKPEELTKTESRYFLEVKTYVRGKRAGKTEMRGVLHREEDRFFLWSGTNSKSFAEDL